MTFANPVGLALLALAIPVLILHILKPRRQSVTVSSTFLWRSLERPVSSATPWQKLRWSLLLLTQLLIVALLAVVAAQPVRLTAAGLAEHTVFIIDASGSMGATDTAGDRVDAAVARAIELRRELPTGGVASIVVAGERPRVVLTASDDSQQFASTLRSVDATQGHPDFAGAFALAESLDTAQSNIGYVFVSDGGITADEERLLPPGTRYERIGTTSTNRAITRLTVEPRGSGLHARVSVRNTGGPEATQTLTIDVDGVQVFNTQVSIPTGGAEDVEADLPGGDVVTAHLEGGDALSIDDDAFVVAGRRPDLAVLLVGDTLFWQELLTSIPGITVDAIDSAGSGTNIGPNGDGYDIVVYNGVDVPDDVKAPFIAIAPPSGLPGLTVTGVAETPAVTLLHSDDALLAGVDLADVKIAQAQRIVVAADATDDETLVAAEAAPLLVRGSAYGERFIYLSFALRDSNLPVKLAFPVLGDRILGELSGTVQSIAALAVGAVIPVEATASGEVVGPDNSRRSYSPGSPAISVDRRGFWLVTTTGGADRTIAVNVPRDESSLTPAQGLTAPAAATTDEAVPARNQHSLLKWFVWPLVALLLLEVWLAWRALGVSRTQWRIATGVRLAVAALLIAALFAPYLRRSSDRVATVYLLDASASMGAVGDRAALEWIRDSLDSRPDGDLAAVVAFGGDARLDRVLEASSTFDGRAVIVDEAATDIAAALRLGSAVLPSDARRRIVVISDGRVTAGDVLNEASALGAGDIPIDVHTVNAAGANDVAVSSIEVPNLARVGDSIDIAVTVTATEAATATVVLRRDGADVDSQTVQLVLGDNTISFTDNAGDSPGAVLRYQAIVQSSGDSQPKNDAAFAAVPVEGPARVLVVEGTPGEAATLTNSIEAGGVATETISPAGVPDVQELATYAGIIFVDVDARSLSSEAIRAVTSAVRDLGRGLVTIGGPRSYGVGGYRESPLSDLLPVDSEILDPKRRKTVAEVLSIDTSGSMAACHCAGENVMGQNVGGVNKTDISRAAAERTIEALTASDEVGVLAWNSNAKWVIDLQALPPSDVVEEGLGSLRPNGNTNMRASLDTAVEALLQSKAELKHIIMFSDGFTDQAIIEETADAAGEIYAEHGITISVLATGEGAAPLLEDIAIAGHGRFYAGTDLDKVPQIMAEEAVIASRDFINEGTFLPEVTSDDRVVAGLAASPDLLGYVATTAKPGSSTLLRIGPDRDPLLATWQAGLGTVTSWTSDASQGWSQQWAGWDGYTDFWSRVVKDTFQAGDTAGAVTASVRNGQLQVTVEGPGNFPDGAVATAVVAGPDGQRYEVPLERSGSDSFEGTVPASRSGTYAVGVDVAADGKTVLASSTLASESYPAEYAPGQSDTATLAKISSLSGGRGEIDPAQVFDADGLTSGFRRMALAGPFLLLAALLWPLAVLLSRLSIRGASAAGARAGVGRVGSRIRASLPSIAKDPSNEPARPAPRPDLATRSAPSPSAPPSSPRSSPSSASSASSASASAPAPARPAAGKPTTSAAAMSDLLAKKRERRESPKPDDT